MSNTVVVALASLLAANAAARPPAAPAEPRRARANLDQVLARFARLPGLHARFRELKQISLLQAPLENTGRIVFCPPGLLARRVEKPIASAFVINDNRIHFGGAGVPAGLDLAQTPLARLFTDSFLLLLRGDRRGLEKIFRITFAPVAPATAAAAGEEDGWQIVLEPREPPMSKIMSRIVLGGSEILLTELEIVETNGDTSRTTFSEIDAQRPCSAAERASLLRMP